MNFNFNNYRQKALLIALIMFTAISFAQRETSKWKLQIAFGVNLPESTGFIVPYEPKPLNFPTINLGVQHMFSGQLGAKIDFGYNRFVNADNTPELKVNYTRFNAQFVYDATRSLSFLPPHMGLVGHVGPGISFAKPLGNLIENKQTFANVLGGLEIHYRMSESVTLYTDASYIYSLSGDKTYNPASDGFGAFTGNVFTLTVGVSVSLSGCYYCD